MKNLLLLLVFPTALLAQNIHIQPLPQGNPNQTNPPPVQQVLNFNPVNNEDNNDNIDRNINIQVQQQFNENNNQQDNANKVKQEKDPCPDCDKVTKAKRENYGNNYSGNYNGGAKKFKMKKNWKRFCYNISHRSGGKKIKSNYSMCFNW